MCHCHWIYVLSMQGALLTLTCILQYENIYHWCFYGKDGWRRTYLHTYIYIEQWKIFLQIIKCELWFQKPNQVALPRMLLCCILTHHLNECGQMLSAQMQLILCFSLLLFFPGKWQLIIAASVLPGWWISHTSFVPTHTCFIRGLFLSVLFN